MIWSPLLICYSTSFGDFCHGRAWGLRGTILSKVNEESPCFPCSKGSHWSFACSTTTATRSLSKANPTTITVSSSLTVSWQRRDFRVMWNSIGILLMPTFQDEMLGLQAPSIRINTILHPSAIQGKCQHIYTVTYS